MTTPIYAYHGSPGTVEDFYEIFSQLKTSGDCELIDGSVLPSLPRKGKIYAYSWGAVPALKHACLNPEMVEEIVLIAPYLFFKNKIVSSFLLGLPVVGEWLLKNAGPKAMDKFLKVSAFPVTPPRAYQHYVEKFKNVAAITKATHEKKEVLLPSIDQLVAFSKREIPITIIWGDQDQTSSCSGQIEPLSILFPHGVLKVVKGAGHALPWTHPQTVAKLIKGLSFEQIEQEFTIGYAEGVSSKNNVYSFLDKHLAERADKPILKWVDKADLNNWNKDLNSELPHRHVTVRELHRYVEAVACGYKKMGLKKGDRVILFVPMSFEMYAAMFALQKIGAIPVFLDSWARRDQLGTAARSVMPKAMISIEPVFDLLKKFPAFKLLPYKVVVGPHRGKYSGSIDEMSKLTERVETEAVEREHTGIITFTTGSSGTPKGANRTHRFLAAQHYALSRVLPYSESDVDLPVFPIFSLNNLASGVPTVIPAFDVGAPGEYDTTILLAQLKACGVTCATLNAYLLNSAAKYCNAHQLPQDQLKRVVTGGAPISRDNMLDITRAAKNAEVWVLYGSTEVEPISHIEAKEMIAYRSLAENDPELVDEGVNVGKMDDGLEYRFIKIRKDPVYIDVASDWSDLLIPEGEVGELIVAGEHVCDGYYNNPEAFSRAKIRDERGVVWHRTGDLARIDHEKNIWLVGRVHNAINRGGVYAFPVRAEVVLKKLPFVKRCAYLGYPDVELGEKIVVVVEAESADDMKVLDKRQEMMVEITRILQKNNILFDGIHFIENIPMDSRHNSKVEYQQLRERMAKGEGYHG